MNAPRKIFVHGLGAVSPAGWGCTLAGRLDQVPSHSHGERGAAGLGKALVHPQRATAGNSPGFFCASSFAARERHQPAHRGRRPRGIGRRRVRYPRRRFAARHHRLHHGRRVAYSRRFYEEVLREPARPARRFFPKPFSTPRPAISRRISIRAEPATPWLATTELFCKGWRWPRTGCWMTGRMVWSLLALKRWTGLSPRRYDCFNMTRFTAPVRRDLLTEGKAAGGRRGTGGHHRFLFIHATPEPVGSRAKNAGAIAALRTG